MNKYKQSISGQASSYDAPAGLRSSKKTGHKMFWLVALLIVGMGSWLPGAEATSPPRPPPIKEKPADGWPAKTCTIDTLKKSGECKPILSRNGCGVCRQPGEDKNCGKYCKACRAGYEKNGCHRTQDWDYCSAYLEHYFGCACKCHGWSPSCDLQSDTVRCKAIPEALIGIVKPGQTGGKGGGDGDGGKGGGDGEDGGKKPKDNPDDVYCIMDGLMDAPATKCNPKTKSDTKLVCKEGAVYCEKQLVAFQPGRIAKCYKAGGFNKEGRLDYPFTGCKGSDGKPGGDGGKPDGDGGKPDGEGDKPKEDGDKPKDNPDEVYCKMEGLADAPATKCSSKTKSDIKLACKEGAVYCEKQLVAFQPGRIAKCYKAGGLNKEGRLDYPFTGCKGGDGDKPKTGGGKPKNDYD